jgi:hypothetical protein
VIDFTMVSREVRSIISRRRELLTFLGTVFAAMGIFLQNVMQGGLPPTLGSLKEHLFAVYAFMLMAPSLIIALRLARLNAGMTLNGVLYARLMEEQTYTRRGTPEGRKRAARVNVFGVSFLMFLLSDLIAGFSAALLALALGTGPWVAAGVGAAVVALMFALYLRYHFRAASFAQSKAASETCAPFDRNEWEAHAAGSMSDGNHDMITIVALVGLIVFSGFEGLSGLGNVSNLEQPDLEANQVVDYGPAAYGFLMTVTAFFGLVTYLRLRVAISTRALELDPTDNPYRPLRLTDSLLGYMLVAFLFAVSLHVLLASLWLRDGRHWPVLLAVDAAAFALAVLAEQVTLVVAGRRRKKAS